VKKLFWILLVYPFIDSVAQDTIKVNGYNVFHYPGGQKESEGLLIDGKPDGIWKSYFVSGIKKSEGKRTNHLVDSLWYFYNEFGDSIEKISYVLGKRNGYSFKFGYKDKKNADNHFITLSKELFVNDLREGKSYYYDDAGKLREIISFKNGKKNGISLQYGKDSLVIAYRLFVNDVLVENERLNRRDKNNLKQGVWKEFYPDGRLKVEAYYRNDTLDGLYKEFSEKGVLVSSLVYRNGLIKEHNASDTLSIEIRNKYDDKGNLIFSGPFRKNVPIGIHRDFEDGKVVRGKLYDDNGILLGEGITDLEGKKSGNWKFYFFSGELKSKGNYFNNQKTGKWTFFFPNGKVVQNGEYKNDLPEGHWTWYYKNGQLWREEDYLAGKEDGHEVEYDETGVIITEGDYVEGEKEGKWSYKVGDHKEEGNYITGLRDGVWKYFFENGNVEFEGNYVQGNPDGKHVYYFDSGELREECYYSMGLKEKNWKKYDKLGNILITITYRDDQEYRINGAKIELPSDTKLIK